MPSFRTIGAAAHLVLVGCASSEGSYYEPPVVEESVPVRATIDTDAELVDRNPGRGVGVFVEYHTGGDWRVDVGCDTTISMLGCSWLVVAEPLEGQLLSVVLHDLEASDDFEALPTSVGMQSSTTDDLDGFSFRSEPGVVLNLFAALDGYAESRFVYWIGDGAVHTGAPEVPFELRPSVP
jgi:hypothetical protein